MAKNDAIAKVIAADPYLKERRAPTAVDQQLYLKEVSFVCPLCGKILRHRGQRKTNKLYEIAHIFPNSPTEEQYTEFQTSGIGLINIQKRIRFQFGSPYGITLSSEEGSGTTVTLSIPRSVKPC